MAFNLLGRVVGYSGEVPWHFPILLLWDKVSRPSITFEGGVVRLRGSSCTTPFIPITQSAMLKTLIHNEVHPYNVQHYYASLYHWKHKRIWRGESKGKSDKETGFMSKFHIHKILLLILL